MITLSPLTFAICHSPLPFTTSFCHVLTNEDSSDSNQDERQDFSDDNDHQTDDADVLIHMAKSGNMDKEFTAAEFLSEKKPKDKNKGKVTACVTYALTVSIIQFSQLVWAQVLASLGSPYVGYP